MKLLFTSLFIHIESIIDHRYLFFSFWNLFKILQNGALVTIALFWLNLYEVLLS